jgi:histidinol-phosphate/aromatic aminotransferase/cobyric acid decarboxylase-like protein
MDFLPDTEQQSLAELVPAHPNLVVLRSLTKFFRLPGLRLGYAIAHPDRLRRWQSWRDPWPVNILAELAAVAALSDRDFSHKIWSWLPGARQQLYQLLAEVPGLSPLPGAANFLLVKCESSVITLQTRLLKQAQILIRDCHSFPELGDNYFRVAVRTVAENQRLVSALAACL